MGTDDSLIRFVSEVSGESYLKVEETLGEGFVRLRISEAERRQAQHDIRSFEDIVVELLRNARDAHAQRLFVATTREGVNRMLTVVDDGVGIPVSLHERVFEPRVTSKLDTMVMDRWGVHGRGMALFSIRTHARVARVTCSAPHKGSAVSVEVDSAVLTERVDQSTWPVIEAGEDGALHVARGPHNIIRRLVEFACEHPALEIYCGTHAEIVATLYALGRRELDTADRMFCDDADRLALWQRPAVAADAAELTAIARSLGLPISERTAHRVLAGELRPLESVLTLLTADEEAPARPAPDIYRDRRSVHIHLADLATFKAEVTEVFEALAERYYLSMRGEPKVTVTRDAITVRFLIEKDD